MNTETLATELHLPERRVIDKLRREGYSPVNGSPLPPKWIAVVADAYSTRRAGRSSATVKAARQLLRETPADQRGAAIIAKRSKDEGEGVDYAKIAALAPLPILGLVASYGVYSFALHFVPWAMALLEACSFEVIYIALAALSGLDEPQRRRANVVSVGALIVSVTYGSIAAALHIVGGEIIKGLSLQWVIVFAGLHGIPVPVLAYAVANLLLHREN